jgi:hypothetical protein
MKRFLAERLLIEFIGVYFIFMALLGKYMKQINHIKGMSSPAAEKIQMLQRIRFIHEPGCFSCRGREERAKKVLLQMIGFEVHRLTEEMNAV